MDSTQLHVMSERLKALRDFGAAVAQAADASADAGWWRVTIPIVSIAHAAAKPLRLGAQAAVLKPAALRRELLERMSAPSRRSMRIEQLAL